VITLGRQTSAGLGLRAGRTPWLSPWCGCTTRWRGG